MVAQMRVMQEAIGDVQPETVHAALQPQIQNLGGNAASRSTSSFIIQLQLGLLAQEFVMVILPPCWLVGTRRVRRTPTASCPAPCRHPGAAPRHTSLFLTIAIAAGGEISACRPEVCASTSSRMIFEPARMGGIATRAAKSWSVP